MSTSSSMVMMLTSLLLQARALAAPAEPPHAQSFTNTTMTSTSTSASTKSSSATPLDSAAVERLESDDGTTIDALTIGAAVAILLLLFLIAGLMFWCGRNRRYPGVKRNGIGSTKTQKAKEPAQRGRLADNVLSTV